MDELISSFTRHVKLPWQDGLSGAQKVWFAVYPKEDERRLRARIPLFESAAIESSHPWMLYDLSDSFPTWIVQNDYAEAYFEDPEFLDDTPLREFGKWVSEDIKSAMESQDTAGNSLVAILGVGTLYGLVHLHSIIEPLESFIPGRLLVFFPGSYDKSTYKLLDARAGSDYRAVPILADYSD